MTSFAGIALAVSVGVHVGAKTTWLVAEHRRREAVRAARSLAVSLGDERARRIAAEVTLRQHQVMAAAVGREAPVASWEWDIANGDVTSSPAMYSLFGLDPESAPPSRARLMALIHAQDRGRAAAWLATRWRMPKRRRRSSCGRCAPMAARVGCAASACASPTTRAGHASC